jgi:hypothetical protein
MKLFYKLSLLLLLVVAHAGLYAQVNYDTCFVFQPGWEEGVDAEIFSCSYYGYDTTNYGNIEDVCATAWTRGAHLSLVRSLLYFNLGSISSAYDIVSAKLSLYFNPTSAEGQHSSLTGSNAAVLQRITTYWQENTVTWNTQPQTDTLHQVFIDSSISPTQDYLNIDVTQLVKDMHANPNSSYGFLIRQQVEVNYRKLVFASSDYPVDSLHPRLEVCVRRNTGFSATEKQEFYAQIFPNPVQDELQIHYNKMLPKAKISIYDSTGKLIREEQVRQSNTVKIRTDSWSPGIYFVHTLLNDKQSAYTRFIIK